MLIGEITIHPGDLIVGDGDGLVAIPRTQIATAIEGAHRREAEEVDILKRLGEGAATLDIYGWNRPGGIDAH